MIRLETDDRRSPYYGICDSSGNAGIHQEQFEKESLNRFAHMCVKMIMSRRSMIASDLKMGDDAVILEVRVYARSKRRRIWAITLYKVNSEEQPGHYFLIIQYWV